MAASQQGSEPKFDRSKVRKLQVADTDKAAKFYVSADLDLLLAFLWQFAKAGWLPPATDDQKRRLDAYDVTCHDRNGVRFYEFRSRGPRDNRVPPLTLFFYLDQRTGRIWVIGFAETADVRRKGEAVLSSMERRAIKIGTILQRGTSWPL